MALAMVMALAMAMAMAMALALAMVMAMVMAMAMAKQKLKEIRKRLGFTQRQFAELIGVQRRTYQRWESGERGISRMVENSVLAIMEKHVMMWGV